MSHTILINQINCKLCTLARYLELIRNQRPLDCDFVYSHQECCRSAYVRYMYFKSPSNRTVFSHP
ncbi:hypothetical protein P879_07698 [Paragonimus westermani]|uniref:Uncharacterized protein n=1 Tax=Paragonimus westermani TaxID=34504 RepID=A0A8T0D2I9_9TREM|nr:hypothetical protein P879_07698 [Paragonimus westermani]